MYVGQYYSSLVTVIYENKIGPIAVKLTCSSLSVPVIGFLLHYKHSTTLYKGTHCELFGLNFPWGAFSSSWGLQGALHSYL